MRRSWSNRRRPPWGCASRRNRSNRRSASFISPPMRLTDRARCSNKALLFLARRASCERTLALGGALRVLGDEAQAIEVHVGARGDGDERLAAHAASFDVTLRARHRQRAGRLQQAARVLKDILDGSA